MRVRCVAEFHGFEFSMVSSSENVAYLLKPAACNEENVYERHHHRKGGLGSKARHDS
jgi:hypothetical protein